MYRVNELGVERVSEGAGVHSAVRAGGVTVLVSTSLERPGAAVRVLRDGKQIATVATYAEEPVLSPRVQFTEGGAQDRKSTRQNSSHMAISRMPSSA